MRLSTRKKQEDLLDLITAHRSADYKAVLNDSSITVDRITGSTETIPVGHFRPIT